jgi:hypothetical protein
MKHLPAALMGDDSSPIAHRNLLSRKLRYLAGRSRVR